jgi:hypothetical protein
MDGICRLAVVERDRDPPGLVPGVNLEKTGICRQRIEQMDSLAAKIVATDAAQDRCMISQASGHNAEVCRRAA